MWFSVALAILVLSLWAGSLLGSASARYWYSQHQPGTQILPVPERKQLESELAELTALQILQLFARATPEEKKQQYTLDEIKTLEELKQSSKEPEIKSVMDLELGLAYLRAAMTEERNKNEQLAKKYMQSAQAIFKSLGWQDYSEEALKAVEKRELAKWEHPRPKAREK